MLLWELSAISYDTPQCRRKPCQVMPYPIHSSVVRRMQHDVYCMFINPCGAGFSPRERGISMDATLKKSLVRIETKEVRELLPGGGVELLS
ncbi:hypothetical protein CEP54_014333 [Fusarium duplospermum]|uniref:Uncharacterized protein n=1 Tax=Fusarium duplospermum TaxID=1325734 RepID=A0A428NWV8_9HYPO|nr:hypothetical protein CEP54_014333 [Fusarium duplospermum]